MKRTSLLITSLFPLPALRMWMDDLIRSSAVFIRNQLYMDTPGKKTERPRQPLMPDEDEHGIFFVDSQHKIKRCNKKVESIFGYTSSEFRGSDLKQFIIERQEQNYSNSHFIYYCGLHKNGSQIPLIVQYLNFDSEEERFLLVIVNQNKKPDLDGRTYHLRQISEHLKRKLRQKNEQLENIVGKLKKAVNELQHQSILKKQLETELLKSNQLFNQLVNHFPDDVFFILNKNFELNQINQTDTSNLNLSLFSREMITEMAKSFSGESVVFETVYNDQIFLVTASPHKQSDGSIENVFILARNISDKKILEQRLNKIAEKEKEYESLQAKVTKIGVISHKLRTPLSTILAAVFLLENYSSFEFEREKSVLMEKIRKAIQNITNLINELDHYPKDESYNTEQKSTLHVVKNVPNED